MKKILLSLFCLISISFADYIPYNDLISGKYKFSEKAGFYTNAYEDIPKIKQAIYSHSKNIVMTEPVRKIKYQYFKFIITEQLYKELINYTDYKSFLTRPGEDGESDVYGLLIDLKYNDKIFKNKLLYETGETKGKDLDYTYNTYFYYFFINQIPEKLNCYGVNFSNISGSKSCEAKSLKDLFNK